MTIEDELTADLIDGYRRAGEEVGYWGRRFLQSVRRNGGVATLKRMLSPRTKGQRVGLDALLEAGRPDLTVEAIILKPKYHALFTPEELKIAAERLGKYGKEARKKVKEREHLYPDELEPGKKYIEGARKQVRVNAFERNTRARKACVNHYGCRCVVCGISFEEKYGEIGKGFIHVHHLKPLSLTVTEYQLDPVADMRPVCPNCHAMLHRSNTVLSIEELKNRMSKNNG
jgi:5-methylcytosine-specific restriction protein A